MQAQEIASILGNAKKVGNGYLASCPVPDHGQGNGDKHPSLSVTDGEDGNILFKCHGGCDQHTVFSTIKDMGILPTLPDRPEYLSSIKPIPVTQTLEHEWHYVDEDGISLFLKQRFKTNDIKGKTYKTLRVMPDGSRVGKLGDCRIIPYRLPELRQAITDGRVIYICEGEKAADSLCSLGVVATTSHAGAGGWNPDLNQYFAGANVVIVPDNDAAGWGYAHKIVESLLGSSSTKSIRVLDLPLTHPKEDAYEWVNRYDGSRSLLAQLAKACPIVSSVEQVWPPLRLHNYVPETQPLQESGVAVKEAKPSRLLVESWDSIKDEPVEWLIESIIPKKAFVALYAPPASYKSFISLDLAEAIATGRDWMGYKIPKKGAVLYICGEGHGGMGARVKACKIQNQSPDGANLYIIRAQLNLRSSPEDFAELLNAINDLIAEIGEPLEIIILDTLMRMSGGGFNENSSEDMGAFITQAGKLQELFECALMVIHHSGKDVTKGLRGHSSLLGAVDTELEIQRQDSVINSADPIVIGNAILTVSKQKDGADFIQIGIEIVLVEIGTLNLGFETLTSLAIRQNQDIASSTKKKSKNNAGTGKNQRLEMESLDKAIKSKGTYRVVDGISRHGVSLEDWKAEFSSMMCKTEQGKKHFNTYWSRAKENNNIVILSDWVWFTHSSENF